MTTMTQLAQPRRGGESKTRDHYHDIVPGGSAGVTKSSGGTKALGNCHAEVWKPHPLALTEVINSHNEVSFLPSSMRFRGKQTSNQIVHIEVWAPQQLWQKNIEQSRT